jgi:hypothetical protein
MSVADYQKSVEFPEEETGLINVLKICKHATKRVMNIISFSVPPQE